MMDLPYQRKIRGLYSRLGDINETDIQELEELGFTQNCDIENTIKQNPEIGNKQLAGTLNALLEEHEHLEKMVTAKIKNLVAGGLDFTDHQCLNTREVLLNMEDTIVYLFRLASVYFPERAAKNIEEIRKFDRQLAKRIEAGLKTQKYNYPNHFIIEQEFWSQLRNPEHKQIILSVMQDLNYIDENDSWVNENIKEKCIKDVGAAVFNLNLMKVETKFISILRSLYDRYGFDYSHLPPPGKHPRWDRKKHSAYYPDIYPRLSNNAIIKEHNKTHPPLSDN